MGDKRKSIDRNTYTTWSGQEMTVSQTADMKVDVSVGEQKIRVKEVVVSRSRYEQGEIVIHIPLSPTEFEFDVDTIPDYRTLVKVTRDGAKKHKFPEHE